MMKFPIENILFGFIACTSFNNLNEFTCFSNFKWNMIVCKWRIQDKDKTVPLAMRK